MIYLAGVVQRFIKTGVVNFGNQAWHFIMMDVHTGIIIIS
jgi:hypothetical protein